jgi:uncharacterized protein YidB (DUF937 family)
MGLFDSIAGQVSGLLSNSGDDRHATLVNEIGSLVNNQPGGLQGLVSSFEANGLAGTISSWIGGGQNLPITAQQLQSVVGNEELHAIAQKCGMSPQVISSHLAEILPQVVDKMTPTGGSA